MKAREGLNLPRRVKGAKHQALVGLFSTPAYYSDPRLAKSKAIKPSKSATAKKPRISKASSHNTDKEDDSDDRPTIPKPAQRKLKKSSAKLPPAQTDDESDDLAIKGTKVPKRVDKGKARTTESPPETFESAGTDVDLDDSRPGPSNMKPLSAEEESLRDVPPDVHEATTVPIISRAAFNLRDASDGEQQQKPPQKKRGRPRKDEGEGEPPSKKQARKPPPKPKPTATKGRARKKVDPHTSDEEGEGNVFTGTKESGPSARKRQRRTPDGSDDEERDKQDGDRSGSNPNRVRLDSIPPEGVIIRQGNGIVEMLLPPVMYVRFWCLS